ncbi:MAG TPA: phosphatase PAP2 family protein [Kofleriaceae bacterium]|nr:phosphatase PAP2 family protein [Kofleriaceae bacterium]
MTTDVVSPTGEEHAKAEADNKAVADSKVTALVLPSPHDRSRPAYQLEPKFDIPIIGIDLVFRFGRVAKTEKAYCAPVCDESELNAVDHLNAGFWNPTWSRASDIGLWSLRAGAVVLLTADEGIRNGLNDVVVVGEATFSASAVSLIMTLAAGRPRPYVFGDPTQPDQLKAPLGTRNSPTASMSFLSGHTTESFAFVTSLYMTERRLHPHSKGPKIMLGVGLTIATFVGVGRIMSGNHFITDVVGGAIVGSSVGVLVPALHRSPVSVVPIVSDTQAGLGVEGAF